MSSWQFEELNVYDTDNNNDNEEDDSLFMWIFCKYKKNLNGNICDILVPKTCIELEKNPLSTTNTKERESMNKWEIIKCLILDSL